MVFRGTITIEWNGCRQSLEMMVFRWFLGQATIGNNGFRWLSTIGPTMEWLSTIKQVYKKERENIISSQPDVYFVKCSTCCVRNEKIEHGFVIRSRWSLAYIWDHFTSYSNKESKKLTQNIVFFSL